MGAISIINTDIVGVDADAVVNAANAELRAGSGVCGAIFSAAGRRELQAACDEVGHCDTGSAVITPGFALRARYIIHAVGPRWSGGGSGEPELLASCYDRALELAVEHGCASVAFPLISSGIYGYPKEEAWRVALAACRAKLAELGDRAPDVLFCVISDQSLELGERMLAEMA